MDITIYNVQSRKGGKYIGLELKKDSPEHQLIKTCKEKWWSGACKLWLVASRQDSWAEVRERFAGYHFVKSEATVSIEDDPWLSTQKKSPAKTAAARETISLNEHQQEALNKLKEALILKQYQYSTMKSYCNNFVGFMLYYKERGVHTLNHEDIRRYLLFKIREHKISESSQNSIVNAIKFYYEVVEKWEKFVVYDLRPKPAHKLPGFLSKEDTARLLKATENLKHRAILQLIYSSGMRLGELTRLKVRDVRFDMGIIEIKCAKGKKDRISMLSAKVKTLLEEYIAMYKPRYWMFEGQTGGKYSDRSVQQILRKAVIKSGVDENTTVHTLRHCFATHLILNGVDIRIVQEYLGHASTKTTEIYTHVTDKLKTKIKSPLDDLDL